MWKLIVFVASAALLLAARETTAQVTVRAADIDSAGRVHIVLSDNRVILPQADSDQVGAEQLFVSKDRRVAGWLALYENCCTTYPVPLKLVLLRAGAGRTVIANALPIWQWAFVPDGRSVVIRQAPVHGSSPMFFERRDARTGRVLASAQVDSITPSAPAWTRLAMPSASVIEQTVSGGRWQTSASTAGNYRIIVRREDGTDSRRHAIIQWIEDRDAGVVVGHDVDLNAAAHVYSLSNPVIVRRGVNWVLQLRAATAPRAEYHSVVEFVLGDPGAVTLVRAPLPVR